MLALFLLGLAILVVAPITAADPNFEKPPPPVHYTSSEHPSNDLDFSYEKWVEAISRQPNGTHLSPEQAIAASLTRSQGWNIRKGSLQIRALSSLENVRRNLLRTRVKHKTSKPPTKSGETPREGIDLNSVRCNTFPRARSSISDVVSCIGQLAASDKKKCNATSPKAFCKSGTSFIIGWRKIDEISIEPPSCQAVARSAGRIMDFCTFNGLVMGETVAWDDPATGVMIRDFAEGYNPSNLTLHY
ncbi:uncharacterized protein CTRU02_212783 [Colletotrichum truncatum]|uniref:Uncharacterized protein n=1 Tax=Colletotrichum truncatum TaxID=5467 RepID=A0ACC3YIV8_COLTU|nr:uncharacterized protein CTRU02_05136 [Colletotrichum truncatum]KAF6794304.1 hypothetical protein CTRU02_05136 [Colletotrichum truncatum]